MTDRGYMLGLRLAGEPAPNLPLLREGGLLCPNRQPQHPPPPPALIATSEHPTPATEIIRSALRKKETAA